MMKLIFKINYYLLMQKFWGFINGLSANINFPKTALSKMIQSEGFLFDANNPLLLSPPFKMTNILANPYRKKIKEYRS